MAARRYLESLRVQQQQQQAAADDDVEMVLRGVGGVAAAAASSSRAPALPLQQQQHFSPAGSPVTRRARGGGTAGDTGGLPPATPTTAAAAAAATYETAEALLQRRLGNVRAVVDEFFEDAGMQIVGASSASGARATRTLPGIVGALRRVPLFPEGWQTFPPPKQARQREKQKSSFLSVFASVQTRAQDRFLLRLDMVMAVLCVGSILLMFIADIVSWIPPSATTAVRGNSTNATSATPAPTLATPAPAVVSLRDRLGPIAVGTVEVLYYAILLTSLANMAVVAVYYYHRLRHKQVEWSRLNGKEIMPRADAYLFWRSVSLPVGLALEWAILLVMPYPWYNTLDDSDAKYLQLAMLLRLYAVVRYAHHASALYRDRHEIVRNSPSLRRANFQVGIADTAKTYLFEHTFGTAVVLYTLINVIGGFCAFVAERNANSGFNPDTGEGTGFNSFFSGVYFMIVSVRTIGYGDIKPITVVGRGATVIFQTLGVALEGLISSVVFNKIAKTKEEKIVDEYLRSFVAWHEFRVASAMLIQAYWKTSARYLYLQRKLDKETMERIVKAHRRRRDFLHQLSLSRAYLDTSDGDATGALRLRVDADARRLLGSAVVGGATVAAAGATQQAASGGGGGGGTAVAGGNGGVTASAASAVSGGATGGANDNPLQILLRHFSNGPAAVRRRARRDGSSFGVHNLAASQDEEEEARLDRMPYLRERDRTTDSAQLAERARYLFAQDVDLTRWGRNVSTNLPRGFEPGRKFFATKKVIGSKGERRVPVGSGHKADLRLEALKNFRHWRLAFKRSVATSADHVIDSKLLVTYELLCSAAEKVRRNAILLQALKRAAQQDIVATRRVVDLSMSGGAPVPFRPATAVVNNEAAAAAAAAAAAPGDGGFSP